MLIMMKQDKIQNKLKNKSKKRYKKTADKIEERRIIYSKMQDVKYKI